MKDLYLASLLALRLHAHTHLHALWAITAAGARQRSDLLNAKSRSLIDIGILIFMLTTAFNAGIQYSRINSITKTQDAQQAQINDIQRDNSTVVAELAAVKQILTDIRDENRGAKQP